MSSLKLAKVEAAVTVRAEAPLLETRKVATGAVIDQEQLREIPTARDPWVALQSVPGVMVDRLNVGGNYSGQQSLFYAKGAMGAQSTFNLDGVNITDMAALGSSGTYYDFDSFEEIQATTGGSDITAFTPGVQLNLVTKRGTNDVHGSARVLLTREKWQSNNASDAFLAQPAGTNIPPRTDTIQDYGVEVGGPLWKDRIWAWGAYGRNQIDLITSTGATDKTTLEDANFKLNAQVFDSTALTVATRRATRSKLGRNVGLTRPTSAEGWNQSGVNGLPSALDKIEVSQVIGSNLFLTANYSYFRGGFQLVPGSRRSRQQRLRGRDRGGVWHNGYYVYKTQRPLHNVGGSGSWFFNTGQMGHELKFGFSYRTGGVVSTTAWPGNGNYGDPRRDQREGRSRPDPRGQPEGHARVLERLPGRHPHVRQPDDQCGRPVRRPDRLQPGRLFGGQPHHPGGPPGDCRGATSRSMFKWKDWSPRVGATYALGDAKKVILKASYARFADQLGIGTLFNVNATQLAGARYYWTDLNNDKVVQRGRARLQQGNPELLRVRSRPSGVADVRQRHRSQPEGGQDRRVRRRVRIGKSCRSSSSAPVTPTANTRIPSSLPRPRPTGSDCLHPVSCSAPQPSGRSARPPASSTGPPLPGRASACRSTLCPRERRRPPFPPFSRRTVPTTTRPTTASS